MLPVRLGPAGSEGFTSRKAKASLTPKAAEGVPSMFDSWEVKVLYQPDGGEG
jgi:hypothetical protein